MTQPDDTETEQDAHEQAKDPKEFGTFLLEHNRGRTHAEMTARMAELVQAVHASGKAGSLTLKLSLKPSKTEGVLEVVDDVKLTAPTARARTSMFYVDPATNSLVRDDPSQRTFF